ncbi:MAG: SDR family oxidoreductase [Betaproteobacteria bacterium]
MTGANHRRGTAWVTGGATGIGFACAKRLGSAGFTVAISGRRVAELERACAELEQAGIAARSYPLDVANPEAVARVAGEVARDLGEVSALVCAAGTNVTARSWKVLAAADFAKVAAINLNGVAYCVSAVLPGMRVAGAGSIVVVSSWAGWTYLPVAGAVYGASKRALGPLVDSLNDQEGERGIRATLLCPAEVATPILGTRPRPPAAADIARMLTPADIAEAAAYAIEAPPHVCLNEIVITPTYNRFYVGAADLARL